MAKSCGARSQITHDRQPLPRGQLNQLFGLGRAGREWFFDKNMLSVFKRALGQPVMGPHRGDNGYRVDGRRTQNFFRVRASLDAGIGLAHAGQRRGALVADGFNSRRVQPVQIAHDVRSPISVSDHSDIYHLFSFVGAGVGICCFSPPVAGGPASVSRSSRPVPLFRLVARARNVRTCRILTFYFNPGLSRAGAWRNPRVVEREGLRGMTRARSISSDTERRSNETETWTGNFE